MNKLSTKLNSLPFDKRQAFLDQYQIPESKRRPRRPRQQDVPKKGGK